MITPDLMIKELLAKINAAKTELKITKAVELSEDESKGNVKPPYIGIYEDFNQMAVFDDASALCSVPCDIVVLYSGSENRTLSAAMSEAYNIAMKLLKLLAGDYNILLAEGDKEYVQLLPADPPLTIMQKSAKQTIIALKFTYNIEL